MLADDAAITTNPIAVAFSDCSLAGPQTIATHMGHRGTRQRASCRSRVVSSKSQGNITGNFSVTEIDWFLNRALGGATLGANGTLAASGNSTIYPGESLLPIYALVDKVAAIYLYNKLRIASFEVGGQETQYLNWSIATAGELETVYGSAWPSTPAYECGTSFLFSDCTLTYSGTAYKMQSFRLSVSNALDAQQYENSITPSRFETPDLQVGLSVQCALRSDTIALYNAALAGAAAKLSISNGSTSGCVTYDFNFGNLKYRQGAPTIPPQGRINMPLQFEAFRSAAVSSFVIGDNQIHVAKTVTP
jgi:hypothetical protein